VWYAVLSILAYLLYLKKNKLKKSPHVSPLKPETGIVDPEERAVARQRLGKHEYARNNKGTAGRGVFYAVCVGQ
jgi:hypothetical protein